MNNFLSRGIVLSLLLSSSLCHAQQVRKFNLQKLLSDSLLITSPKQNVTALADGDKNGVSCNDIVWLKNVTFSTGSIDIDLRGKDVFQQSFLGIAFHGAYNTPYDAIYFRPFNFQSPDTLRRKHMVQYISEPEYPWNRLRKEHPLVYEHGIVPAPMAASWFHAHIVVSETEIKVYVNHAKTPSLVVKKLNTRNDGSIGLWNDALNGDFANLVVRSAK
ncbi:MAG TPA: hypothetical protein VGI43_05205 [Mucilaginibacter sp.]|jgi:hypothetical protein